MKAILKDKNTVLKEAQIPYYGVFTRLDDKGKATHLLSFTLLDGKELDIELTEEEADGIRACICDEQVDLIIARRRKKG